MRNISTNHFSAIHNVRFKIKEIIKTNMKFLWIIYLIYLKLNPSEADAPWVERVHAPYKFEPDISPYINGTDVRVPYAYETPDYRVEEPLFLPYRGKFYAEAERPYRLSPHFLSTYDWNRLHKKENIQYVGCYCTTVYKKYTPLAGCAVLTTRHILTTATSTHLILRDRYDYPTLENILGAWYDTNHNNYNSSMYLTPARIHYHPRWHYPEHVNRSHPFSFTFDLAVWATTHNVYGWYFNLNSAILCLRASSHPRQYGSPAPSWEKFVIVGFQFVWAYKRIPMPWFKYGVITTNHVTPCPKTEWGWFACIMGDWAKYGIEGGAALHRTFRGRAWRYDGLVAMGAFSMRLRSPQLVHYFTILDCHVVLEFIFRAYESTDKYKWLDARFYDTRYYAPVVKPGFWIYHNYEIGWQYKYYPVLH